MTMASYLRSFFGYGSSPSQGQSGGGKSHSRSRSSSSTANVHAKPYIIPSSTPSAASSSRPDVKRANSYSASRTNTPSPLRYPTYDSRRSHDSSRPKTSPSAQAAAPVYRRASYKPKEHVHYPVFAPPGYTTPASSRSNSSSSLYAHGMPPSTPLSTSSRTNAQYGDRRPHVQQNHTWNGSVSGSASGSSSHGHAPRPSLHPTTLHMHPLLSYTRLHHAPISYDISFAPSARTVLDRTIHSPVPAHTLAQPATEPPTPASTRLVLRSHKFPWLVVVGPVGSPSGTSPSSSFYLGSGSRKPSRSNACLTNLDVLYAVHTTLMTRVTPGEWESLGNGSKAQRKVAAAYEKRCQRMGGGWEGGVRRLDWLGSKTRFVGVEMDKGTAAGGTVGKLVFGKA
ncbi:hypothetical protein EW146_g2757 [Bondarzewia mesenterica]|uniref:DUF6699 domain-containing protein n=1 Tax=Bondarzewia mesenterica TaxID=1095465 RepID=A0A4S4LZM9_9AGAM|nr:hypothetical protein EW146_g2757 [Bondarzewia mesenterica]